MSNSEIKKKCNKCGSPTLIPERVTRKVGCIWCLFCGRKAEDYIDISRRKDNEKTKA
jgi:hypothetical protein